MLYNRLSLYFVWSVDIYNDKLSIQTIHSFNNQLRVIRVFTIIIQNTLASI